MAGARGARTMPRTAGEEVAVRNVFVVGLDLFNLKLLRTIPGAEEYAFHPLLSYEEVRQPPDRFPPFEELLAKARDELEAFPDTVDGVVGYWDFPTTGLVALLRHERGLPGPTPEAVTRCEHKYWSRRLQAEVVPGLVPRCRVLDPFAGEPALDLAYPLWLKPVKAHSSFLGFRIGSDRELAAALARIREGIEPIAEPFNGFLAHVDLPPEIAPVDGYYCIAEEIISEGHQCTLEGYMLNGETHIYGAVDSLRSGRHRSSFARYQYPSALPRRTRLRMIDAADRVMRHIGYDGAAFNMEFYWDPGTDAIRLLEVNSRISKSHAPLFRLVDGASNQQIPVDLVLGRRPRFPQRQGRCRVAGKFMLRIHEDAVVERSPTAEDIRAVQARHPEALVRVLAPAGTRLAHLLFQDGYSFEIAEIYLGAESQKALLAKGREVEAMLGFRLRRLTPEAA